MGGTGQVWKLLGAAELRARPLRSERWLCVEHERSRHSWRTTPESDEVQSVTGAGRQEAPHRWSGFPTMGALDQKPQWKLLASLEWANLLEPRLCDEAQGEPAGVANV